MGLHEGRTTEVHPIEVRPTSGREAVVMAAVAVVERAAIDRAGGTHSTPGTTTDGTIGAVQMITGTGATAAAVRRRVRATPITHTVSAMMTAPIAIVMTTGTHTATAPMAMATRRHGVATIRATAMRIGGLAVVVVERTAAVAAGSVVVAGGAHLLR